MRFCVSKLIKIWRSPGRPWTWPIDEKNKKPPENTSWLPDRALLGSQGGFLGLHGAYVGSQEGNRGSSRFNSKFLWQFSIRLESLFEERFFYVSLRLLLYEHFRVVCFVRSETCVSICYSLSTSRESESDRINRFLDYKSCWELLNHISVLR